MLELEMTDTFAGQTNYSWVKRVENFELPENCTYAKKLKLIKIALDIEGLKLKKVADSGDFEAWDIKGCCIRVMLSVKY